MSWIIFLKMDSSRKGIEKKNSTTKILDPWDPDTLYRGVQAVIIILMSEDFRATPFERLFFCIFWKGLVSHLNYPGFCDLQNISDKICSL